MRPYAERHVEPHQAASKTLARFEAPVVPEHTQAIQTGCHPINHLPHPLQANPECTSPDGREIVVPCSTTQASGVRDPTH